MGLSSNSWTYLLKDRTVRLLLANASTVLTAQVVMVPVALLAERFCDSWGRKPLMAIAFWVLPLRIALYAFVSTPSGLNGSDARQGRVQYPHGALCHGPRGRRRCGPHRFRPAWYSISAFAALATIGAAVFTKFIPETRTGGTKETDSIPDVATVAPELT